MGLTGQNKTAAVVGVCDEIELIDFCILHLESQGVFPIVMIDMGSRDGTRLRLREFSRTGRVVLLERGDNPSLDLNYLMDGVDHVRDKFAVDWIIIQDADEFWISSNGNLTQTLNDSQNSAYSAKRYNACLSTELQDFFSSADKDFNIASLDVWARPQRISRLSMDTDREIAWISAQPAPKIAIRVDCKGSILPGGHLMHDINGAIVSPESHPYIIIVHIPFSSINRFKKKIGRVRQCMDMSRDHFVAETGWHWKRWVEIDDRNMLQEEYDRQILPKSAQFVARKDGIICSAHDVLRKSS